VQKIFGELLTSNRSDYYLLKKVLLSNHLKNRLGAKKVEAIVKWFDAYNNAFKAYNPLDLDQCEEKLRYKNLVA